MRGASKHCGWIVALFVLLCCGMTGCGFRREATVSDEFAASYNQPRNVAVMAFEAPTFDQQRVGSVAAGLIKVPNAGEAFPGLAASQLDGHLGMKTLQRTEVLEALKLAKVKESELLEKTDYARIHALTKADAVVFGSVQRWTHSYVLFFPKGSIEFEMICVALPSGKELWRVHTDSTMSGSDDRTTAIMALRDAVEALEQKVKPE